MSLGHRSLGSYHEKLHESHNLLIGFSLFFYLKTILDFYPRNVATASSYLGLHGPQFSTSRASVMLFTWLYHTSVRSSTLFRVLPHIVSESCTWSTRVRPHNLSSLYKLELIFQKNRMLLDLIPYRIIEFPNCWIVPIIRTFVYFFVSERQAPHSSRASSASACTLSPKSNLSLCAYSAF